MPCRFQEIAGLEGGGRAHANGRLRCFGDDVGCRRWKCCEQLYGSRALENEGGATMEPTRISEKLRTIKFRKDVESHSHEFR